MSKDLIAYLKTIARSTKGTKEIKNQFIKRLEKGALTRDEDLKTHFCVYFAAYDPKIQQVFIGHHIKAGLWLFNGGHIDKGELPWEALKREAREEWGENSKLNGNNKSPSLLTITKINNPTKQTCKLHYDIWYFIPLSKKAFIPDESSLAKEFHQTGWKTIIEAKGLMKDPNTLIALAEIQNYLNPVG